MNEEELTRLEALCKEAPVDMTDEVLDMDIREWRVFPVEGALPFYDAAREALPALIAELRQLRKYVALSEQAARTFLQEEKARRAVVFERSTVFSRPECVFKYCASPLDCQERCMLTKAAPDTQEPA